MELSVWRYRIYKNNQTLPHPTLFPDIFANNSQLCSPTICRAFQCSSNFPKELLTKKDTLFSEIQTTQIYEIKSSPGNHGKYTVIGFLKYGIGTHQVLVQLKKKDHVIFK